MSKKEPVTPMVDKPIIETIINSTAIGLMSFAAVNLTSHDTDTVGWIQSLLLIFLAMGLEWFKYYGRRIKLWQ